MTSRANEREALSALRFESAKLATLSLIECKALRVDELRCAAISSIDLEGCSALDAATVACAVRKLDLGTCRHVRELRLHSERCHRELVLEGCLRLSAAHLLCP